MPACLPLCAMLPTDTNITPRRTTNEVHTPSLYVVTYPICTDNQAEFLNLTTPICKCTGNYRTKISPKYTSDYKVWHLKLNVVLLLTCRCQVIGCGMPQSDALLVSFVECDCGNCTMPPYTMEFASIAVRRNISDKYTHEFDANSSHRYAMQAAFAHYSDVWTMRSSKVANLEI